MKLKGKVIRNLFGIKSTFQLWDLDYWPCPKCGRDKMEFVNGRTFGFCLSCKHYMQEYRYRKWWRQFSFWSFANYLKMRRKEYENR